MALRIVPRYLAFGLSVQIAEELLSVEDVRLATLDRSITQEE